MGNTELWIMSGLGALGLALICYELFARRRERTAAAPIVYADEPSPVVTDLREEEPVTVREYFAPLTAAPDLASESPSLAPGVITPAEKPKRTARPKQANNRNKAKKRKAVKRKRAA